MALMRRWKSRPQHQSATAHCSRTAPADPWHSPAGAQELSTASKVYIAEAILDDKAANRGGFSLNSIRTLNYVRAVFRAFVADRYQRFIFRIILAGSGIVDAFKDADDNAFGRFSRQRKGLAATNDKFSAVPSNNRICTHQVGLIGCRVYDFDLGDQICRWFCLGTDSMHTERANRGAAREGERNGRTNFHWKSPDRHPVVPTR